MSAPFKKPVRIGMLTPSSNTVLEPYTSAMFAAFGEDASAHFGRFRVVEISMSGPARISSAMHRSWRPPVGWPRPRSI